MKRTIFKGIPHKCKNNDDGDGGSKRDRETENEYEKQKLIFESRSAPNFHSQTSKLRTISYKSRKSLCEILISLSFKGIIN